MKCKFTRKRTTIGVDETLIAFFDFDPDDDVTPDIIRDLHQRFSVILRVINSRYVIDVREFRKFEIETNLILVNNFKYMGLNYTLHAFIGHGWETILKNGCQGLGTVNQN